MELSGVEWCRVVLSDAEGAHPAVGVSVEGSGVRLWRGWEEALYSVLLSCARLDLS